MLGGLVKALASRGLDDWFSSRFEVADSITHSVNNFSYLLYKVRRETVSASGSPCATGKSPVCSPWTSQDEEYGAEGRKILHDLVLGYAGHLKKQAKKSGVNPKIFPA